MEGNQTLTDKEKLNALTKKLNREFNEVKQRYHMNSSRLTQSKSVIAVMNEYYRGYCSCLREIKVYLEKLNG